LADHAVPAMFTLSWRTKGPARAQLGKLIDNWLELASKAQPNWMTPLVTPDFKQILVDVQGLSFAACRECAYS
jgi:hypothetical protein